MTLDADSDDFDGGNPLAAEMGEDVPPNELREFALAKMNGFYMPLIRAVAMYRGNRMMALDALVLALGKGGDWIPERSAVEVAVKHFHDAKKKFTVTKVVKLLQDAKNIPPMPGQRSDEGRANMTRGRNSQLK